jgi:hypothetical protein
MKLSTQWLIVISTIIAPFLLLLPLGILWVWEKELLFWWLGISVACSMVGWSWAYYLRERKIATLANAPEVEPNRHWSDTGNTAWQKVEAIAETITIEAYPFTQREKLVDLGKDILKMVADHYHPQSNNSLLEIPLPYLLRIVESVSADLRTNFVAQVPGSHIITINGIIRGHQLTTLANKYYNLYRAASLPLNPAFSLLREVKDLLSKSLFNNAADSIKLWLLQTYVKKVGYYGIELYSGQMVLDEAAFESHITDYSEQDLQCVQEPSSSLEPLKLLILGQVKAGKSSLVNALLGEAKAVVDVLPSTNQLTPYVMKREGMEQAILLDSVGYEDKQNSTQLCKQIEADILNSDFIFLVCKANAAARQSDKQVFDEINRLFQAHIDIAKPPVLVILTHIDQLRPPREWQPPYNIVTPDTTKARSIRQAMEIVATDLQVNLEQVIPVNLKNEALYYNVEEGVIPTLLANLDEAKRIRYLRCMQSFKKAEYWQQLWTQTCNASTVVVNAAGKMVKELKRE